MYLNVNYRLGAKFYRLIYALLQNNRTSGFTAIDGRFNIRKSITLVRTITATLSFFTGIMYASSKFSY